MTIPLFFGEFEDPTYEYRFVLVQAADPTYVYADLTSATGKEVDLQQNRAGSVTLTLPLNSLEAMMIEPVKHGIVVYKGIDPIFGGRIWDLEESPPNLVVRAIGWFEDLNRRLWRMTAPTASDPTFENADFENSPAGWYMSIGSISSIVATSAEVQAGTFGGALVAGAAGNPALFAVVANAYTFTDEFTYTARLFMKSASGNRAVTLRFGALFYQDFTERTFTITEDDWNEVGISWTPSGVHAPYAGMWPWPNSEYQPTPGFIWLEVYVPVPIITGEDLYLDSATITAEGNTDIERTFFEADAGQIVKAVLDDVNADFATGITLAQSDIVTSLLRTRTYARYQNLGQLIQELSDVEGGFDWFIHPITKKLRLEWTSNLPFGHGQVRDEISFGFGTGLDNVARCSRKTDATELANYVIVVGKYGSSFDESLNSQAAFGMFEDRITLSDVPDEEVIGAYAAIEVLLRREPRETYAFVPHPMGDPNDPDPSHPRLYHDYWLGDCVYLSASYGRMQFDRRLMRVMGLKISVDEDGVERVTEVSALTMGITHNVTPD